MLTLPPLSAVIPPNEGNDSRSPGVPSVPGLKNYFRPKREIKLTRPGIHSNLLFLLNLTTLLLMSKGNDEALRLERMPGSPMPMKLGIGKCTFGFETNGCFSWIPVLRITAGNIDLVVNAVMIINKE